MRGGGEVTRYKQPSAEKHSGVSVQLLHRRPEHQNSGKPASKACVKVSSLKFPFFQSEPPTSCMCNATKSAPCSRTSACSSCTQKGRALSI